MLNLGVGQKAEGAQETENGSDKELEPEEKIEGEEYTQGYWAKRERVWTRVQTL